jgi:hypothetical protein
MSQNGASRSSLLGTQNLLDVARGGRADSARRVRKCPSPGSAIRGTKVGLCAGMVRDRVRRQAISKRKEIARRLISLEVLRLSRQGHTVDYMKTLSGSLPPIHAPSLTVSGAWIVMTVGPFSKQSSVAYR